jgi:hypothetical protein
MGASERVFTIVFNCEASVGCQYEFTHSELASS